MNRLFVRLLLLVTVATIGSGMLMVALLDYQFSPTLNGQLEPVVGPGLRAIADRIAEGEAPEEVFDGARPGVGNTLALVDIDRLDLADLLHQRLLDGAPIVVGTGLDRLAYQRVPGSDQAVEFLMISLESKQLQWGQLPGTRARGLPATIPDLTPLERQQLQWRPIRHGDLIVWSTEDGVLQRQEIPDLHNVRTLGLALSLIGLALALLVSLWPVRQELIALSEGTARLRDGDLTARVPVRGSRPGAVGDVSIQVNAMADRLQQLIEQHEDLMRSVSHEMQTPIARLMFSVEALQEDPDRTEEHLDGMRETLREMRILADEVLQFNRLAQGQEALLQRVPTDLVELAEDVTLSVPGARAEGPATAEVPVDTRLAYRALRNLVDNAVAYGTPPIVRVEDHGDRVVVHVDDAGPGVPEPERTRIFEPFHRVDGSRSRATGGTGLGLAIVDRIVARHGGGCACTQSPEGGARFTVWWPRSLPG